MSDGSKDRPHVKLGRDNGDPGWKQVNDLFERHGLLNPDWRMRDELVMWLWWARYGEALDEKISNRT